MKWFLTKYKDTVDSVSCVRMAQFKTKASLYSLVQIKKTYFGTMCFQVYNNYVAEDAQVSICGIFFSISVFFLAF